MTTTVLGRVTMIPRGNYVNGETYRYLELVRFSGASYMCRVTLTTNAPTNTTDWVLLAQDGASIGEGSPTDIDGIIKGDGTEFTVATPHTDYAMPTTGSYLLKGNGAGGFADASNDYQVKLVNTVGAGQNIKTINNVPILGTGDISIATAVNSGGSTNISGILQGNGTSLSAATTTGSGSVVLNTSPTFAGVVSDPIGDIRKLTFVSKTANYTLVAGDSKYTIRAESSCSTITINSNVFSAGDNVVILNDRTSALTLSFSGMTAYINGINTNRASMTLEQRGICSLLFVTSSLVYVTGLVS
jgi:hypothetical protein